MADTTREIVKNMFASAWQDGVYHKNPKYSRRDALFTDKTMDLIQSEITKAKEHLLDELEKDKWFMGTPDGQRGEHVIFLAAIEAKRKQIKEGK